MSELTTQNTFYDLLTVKGDEAKITFTKMYVEAEVTRFRILNIPDHDIMKYFHKAQKTGADPTVDDIWLVASKVKVGNNQYMTVGTSMFSYHFLERKAKEIMKQEGLGLLWPQAEVVEGSYFDPAIGEGRQTIKAIASMEINGIKYSYTAWYPEYVQVDYSTGKPRGTWGNKPHLLLRKCSIMGLLRSLFPEALSGYYAEEEMQAYQDDESIKTEVIQEIKTDKLIEKKKETTASLEKKEEKKNNNIEVESLISSIKSNLGIITTDMTVAQKGEKLFELMNIRSFKDIDKLSLEQLREKNDVLNKLVFETKNAEIERLMAVSNQEKNKPELDAPSSDDSDDVPPYDDSDIPADAYEDTVHLEPIEPEVMPPEKEVKKKTTSSKASSSSKPSFKL